MSLNIKELTMTSIKMKRAFTMIELVYVIVIIGILSAIAIPKFSQVGVMARTSKAASELASVRSALATERQKRILRGDTDPITSLGNVFTNFSAAKDGSTPKVLDYPPTVCSGSQKGCWTSSGTSYIYRFADSGDAKFKLVNSKLECDNDASDCAKLEK